MHMDEQVMAAMARWPNVPAVYGWLSLPESGQWRLHPQGDALQHPESRGEAITSPQILAFMNRNYAADAHGQWFFQNGPQRVYVRLDCAPYVVQLTTDVATGSLKLRTHTGLDVGKVSALYLDENGRCYAATDLGGALIAGRDLPALLDTFQLADTFAPDTGLHEALAECLESGASVPLVAHGIQGFPDTSFTLSPCRHADLERLLTFLRHPRPDPETAQAG